MAKKKLKFNTLAIHGGQEPDRSTGAVMTPIYQTSTYAQSALGTHPDFEYSRSQNPTRQALEKSIASLEGAERGLAFGSGMAAIDAVLKLLQPGDEVICTNDLYGGSYRLFTSQFTQYGITFKFCKMNQPQDLSQQLNERTKMIWVETPTNPMMQVIDIAALAKLAKEAGAFLTVDNTFATPYLQRPIALGADIVVHSATKYLGGHSDVVLGLLAIKDQRLGKQLAYIQNASGAICGPMDAFLTLRGIKTLPLRMQRHCENGQAIARYLKDHPQVKAVYWPGFPDHPNHAVAKKQMAHYGGMVSFKLKEDRYERAAQVVSALDLFTLAESLGGVESLAGHPASMTHAALPKEERERNGISDGLIRLSVGIEDAQDLIDDLAQALKSL